MQDANNPRRLLGRIRCVLECIDCFRRAVPLPEVLRYVPGEVLYKICKDPSTASSARSLLTVWEAPGYSKQNLKKLSRATVEVRKGSCVRATGDEYGNANGLWVKLSKEQMEEYRESCDMAEGWILLSGQDEGGDRLVAIESSDKTFRQQQLFGVDYKPLSRWEEVVDVTYSMRLGGKPRITEPDVEAVQKLRFIPPSWTYECDEDLVHFLHEHVGKEDETLGNMKQFVESINVSSATEENNLSSLTDGQHDTYWESDGSHGQHWIQLHMKEGTVVKKLLLTVDATDENYMPKRVMVYGGERDNLKKLNDVIIEDNLIGDVCVLDDMMSHMPLIEIRITECFDEGIDVRIRGIKIKSSKERDLGLTADMFHPPNLVRYPRLEAIDPDVLYRRATVIQRFVKLLDQVLHHLVPVWDHSIGTFNQLKYIKQFLLLSKRRCPLITQCLKDSETSKPNLMPRLYINRRLAVEHRDNPALDPTYKKTVFSQVYEGLKPTDKSEKPLDYRHIIDALQAGLLKVVPQAVLDLLTWQELEKKVCGDPEISVEALKKLTRFEDLEPTDIRVQYFWEALNNFTNEDRSRFLRFVTGRSRLPAPIYIYPDKSGSDTTDSLPESSTCSSTLYLPNYPSAKICEEKLRYAAYNCVAIDTDMSPWEE
ncbi:E3 ubiquitin-protein ligase HECTD3 [Rhinoderma darwinii]|uniref:E3 ubiquitin-protein ligase HECTD3 n=1 Tax=Rhinoderma darwinii TaxID=43563 RepID=UPI003F679894